MPQEIEDIRNKLRFTILPKIVLGSYVSRWWLMRLDRFHAYAVNILTVLGGIAVSAPAQEWLSAASRIGQPSSDAALVNIPALTNPANVAALVLLAIWGTLKIIVREETVQKRATLARSFQNAMIAARGRLEDILPEHDPMKALNELFLNNIKPLYDRMGEENALPRLSKRVERRLEQEVKAEFEQMVQKYQALWKPAHQSGQPTPAQQGAVK
jgi:hypothetical protein